MHENIRAIGMWQGASLTDRLDPHPPPINEEIPPVVADTVPSAQPAREPMTTPEHHKPRAIYGNLGRNPIFTATARGAAIHFPIAERIAGEEAPVWHHVYTTRDLAITVRDLGLVTGNKVKVVGYAHERTKIINGQEKTVSEVYALSVRPIRLPAKPKR